MNYQSLNVAKDRLERIRAFEFNQLGMAVEQNVLLSSNGHVDPNGIFRRSTQVTTVTNSPFLRRIVVTVETLNPYTRRFDGMSQRLETLMTHFEVEM